MKRFEELLNKNVLFDSHSHLDFFQDDKSLDVNLVENYSIARIIERAIEAKVESVINVSTDIEQLKSQFIRKEIINGIGIHPEYFINGTDLSQRATVDESLLKNKILLMDKLLRDGKYEIVGECGLDYYWISKLELSEVEKNRSVEIQKFALYEQLKLAKKYDLFVSLHTRESFADTFDLVKEIGHKKIIFHSFTGSLNEAKKIHDEGFYHGVNGIITYSKAQEIRDTLKMFMGKVENAEPIDFYNKQILFETDAPLLKPSNANTKLNEPANVAKIFDFCRKLVVK